MKTKKKNREIAVGKFKFELFGGRFTVASLKECLHFYSDYLEFCKKGMLYPVTPITFIFVIASSQRKTEYGKRRLVRQLSEKLGLFPLLFWIELRSYMWRTVNNYLNVAFEEAKKAEKRKTRWALLPPWTPKM